METPVSIELPITYDARLVEELVELVPDELAVGLVFFSFLGSIWLIGPATIVAYWADQTPKTLSWIAIIIGCYALLAVLKPIFDVPRPSVEPDIDPGYIPLIFEPLYHEAVTLDSESFPSGHAIAATVFWGLLAVDLQIGTSRQRMTAAVGIVGLVGTIRLALGTHFLMDILVGVAIGAGYLVVMLWLRRHVANPLAVLFLVAIGLTALALPGDRGHEAINLFGATLAAILVLRYRDRLTLTTRRREQLLGWAATAGVVGILVGLTLGGVASPLRFAASFALATMVMLVPTVVPASTRLSHTLTR